MNTFVILHNGVDPYPALASIAAKSVRRYSAHTVGVFDVGREPIPMMDKGVLRVCQFNRLRWLAENLGGFSDRICLLDADMVATPFVDGVWCNTMSDSIPLFMEHPHKANPSLAEKVPIKHECVMRYFVPSIWSNKSWWFARLCMNVMVAENVDEEIASDLILLGSWIRERMPYKFVQMDKGETWQTGHPWFYHGVKDPANAAELLKSMP